MKIKYLLLSLLLVLLTSCSGNDENNSDEPSQMETNDDDVDGDTQDDSDDDNSEDEDEDDSNDDNEDEDESDDNAAYQGEFMSGAHTTTGKAIVNSSITELILDDFKTDNGPVLELYLASDQETTQFISLGELKGLEGDFTYDLPENIDFEIYKYVVVWCVEFSVNFGYAQLN